MTIRRVVKSAAWIGAMSAAAGCGWDHLDAIGPAAGGDATQLGDRPNDAAASVADATPGAAADDAAAEASAAEGGVSSDSAAADAASVSDASSADGASSSRACMGSPIVVRQWTFDSDVQGWTLALNPGVQAGLAWNGSMGNPSPGSLQVDVTPGSADAGPANGAWARYNTMALGDLSGRTISAWVWLDRGTSPQLKLFVQTGNEYVWADNGIVTLSPRTWTCVNMAVSFPAYNGPNYDPTSVVAVGLEMLGSAPFRILLDTVRYY